MVVEDRPAARALHQLSVHLPHLVALIVAIIDTEDDIAALTAPARLDAITTTVVEVEVAPMEEEAVPTMGAHLEVHLTDITALRVQC